MAITMFSASVAVLSVHLLTQLRSAYSETVRARERLVAANYTFHYVLCEAWEICIPQSKRSLQRPTSPSWHYVLHDVLQIQHPRISSTITRHMKFIYHHGLHVYSLLWILNCDKETQLLLVRFKTMHDGEQCMESWSRREAAANTQIEFKQWIQMYQVKGGNI